MSNQFKEVANDQKSTDTEDLKDKSLLTVLKDLRIENRVSAHMPGHKYGGLGLRASFNDFWDIDITEIPGSDNLHEPEDVLLFAKERAARVYGSKESFFMVNGSTGGIMAMLLGSVKRGERVLICRDAHRSIHQAVSLGGFNPVYVKPEVDQSTGIAIGLDVEGVEEAFQAYSDIKAVVCTYPSYSGACNHLQPIIERAHQYGAQVLVDEAHGAHLWLSEELPPSAVNLGADVVVQSLHKTMPALTQTAILHIGTDRANREGIQKYLAIFQSSSPSYVLLASIDEAIRIGSLCGTEAMQACLSSVRALKRYARELGYGCFDLDNLTGAWHFDETKVCLSGVNFGLDGYALDEKLREKGIQAEYAQKSHVLLMFSMANAQEDYDRIQVALSLISQEMKHSEPLKIPVTPRLNQRLSKPLSVLPWQAETMDSMWVDMSVSVGKVAADMVILYPPGVPLLCPGEEIESDHVLYLSELARKGHKILGLHENRIRILTL